MGQNGYLGRWQKEKYCSNFISKNMHTMPTVLSRSWTRVTFSISYDDNHYSTNASAVKLKESQKENTNFRFMLFPKDFTPKIKLLNIVTWYATGRGKGRSIPLPFCVWINRLTVKGRYERKSTPRTPWPAVWWTKKRIQVTRVS